VCLCTGRYCFAGYALNLLPYLGVTRQAFVYHYMPALYYGSILVGVLMDMLLPRSLKSGVAAAVIAASAAAFLLLAPWVYALPITHSAHASRRWISTWD
jgi:dolichyl-phosphate-mannose--protein O-mannosyl transferase